MTLQTNLDAILKRACESGKVPGVTVAVGTRDGLIYEAGFGRRALSEDDAMTADTVGWIASMTKAVTAACAMQLVEQGKLTLDGPIADVLPVLAETQVLEGFDASGQPRLRPARRPITLRHLMTHTAGFSYDMWNADIAAYQKARNIPGVVSCQNKALSTPLVFDPGDRWEYGINIDWIGKAVEAVSGEKLGAYMRANLLEPLTMADTGFKLGPSQTARRAAVHVRGPEGLAATPVVVEQNPEFEMGGGGLYGTVGDYLRFTRMILNGGVLDGARVLKSETVALMSQNAMGAIRCVPMQSVNAGSSNNVEFVAGMQWGLSFMINPQPLPTGRSAGSLAWAGLANSYYWIDPAKGVAGVFMTQILPFADKEALPLFQAFETEVYRSLAA
jgi:methyl acetate hydrolase